MCVRATKVPEHTDAATARVHRRRGMPASTPLMQTLPLNEGDPIRVTGCELPKGKVIQLQAQTVYFLEISDPKAA